MTSAAAGEVTVSFQGAPGAYGEAAVAEFWRNRARAIPCRTFGSALESIVQGSADFGVIPVWNSSIGDVRTACDALASMEHMLERVDTVTIPVRHALLALPGASLEGLRAVASHPAALDQCRHFLARHSRLRPIDAWDTAGAASELAALARAGEAQQHPHEPADTVLISQHPPWHGSVTELPVSSLAVVAGKTAAGRHGLTILAEDIQDDAGNATRFVVLRRREGATC